jgi:WD40 repeat protein
VDNTARVWDVETGKEIARMTHDAYVTTVAFSTDGKFVVSGSADGTVRAWDIYKVRTISTLNNINSLIITSSNEKHIAYIWLSGKEVYIDEVISGTRIILSQNDYFKSIAFSPDGKYLISGSQDKTVRIWETSTGQEINRFKHNDGVNFVAFSPDGKYIVSGSQDKTARVWEISTGKELSRLIHDSVVDSVMFTQDGKYIISRDDNDITYMWIWRPDDLIADTCSRIARNLTRAEWEQYIGAVLPYQAICDNLPIEPEVSATP